MTHANDPKKDKRNKTKWLTEQSEAKKAISFRTDFKRKDSERDQWTKKERRLSHCMNQLKVYSNIEIC